MAFKFLFVYLLLVVVFCLFCFKVSSDLKNIDTGVNPKAKSHVTIRRAVLEEIGNKVRTRTVEVTKVTRAGRRVCGEPHCAGPTLVILPCSLFFSLIETSEHQSTSSSHQSNKCQQTAKAHSFREASADGDAGSKGRRP